MIDKSVVNRIARGEDLTTEFISDASNFRKICQALCSLLNTKGGIIICGVNDKGGGGGVKGNASELARKLELTLKKSISPVALFSVTVTKDAKKALIVVDAPRGPDGPYLFENVVWVKERDAVRPADARALRAMLASHVDQGERWERRLSPSMSEEDLDTGELQALVRDAEKHQRFLFSDSNNQARVLEELSLATASGYTNGGDALFSRQPGRRHPQCRVQFVHFKGNKLSDEFIDNRWIDGPLVRVCEEVFTAVRAVSAVKSAFSKSEIRRTDYPSYDLQAIREGIVNAFVHRDYSAYSGGLRVSIYHSRIEIWNSGRLPKGLTASSLGRKQESIQINPDVAQVFYIRKFMERVGRGTELIAEASKALGAAPPEWRDEPTGVTLSIYSAQHSRTSRLLGDKASLNKRQQRLLAVLGPSGSFTLKNFHSRFAKDVSERQARRDLKQLEQAGQLRMEGGGPSTIYRLIRPSHD